MNPRLFPALSLDGQHKADGSLDIEYDGALVYSAGIGPVFSTTREILFGAQAGSPLGPGLLWYHPMHGAGRISGPTAIGGNAIAAASGRWIIARADPPRLIWDDGTVVMGFGAPCLSDDAQHLACLKHEGSVLYLDGKPVVDANGAPFVNVTSPCMRAGSLTWEMPDGSVWGIVDVANQASVAQPLSVLGVHQTKPHPVWVPSVGRLLFTSIADDLLLLQYWGTTMGWAIFQGDLDQGHHDARPYGTTHEVRLGWSSHGEAMEELLSLDLAAFDLRYLVGHVPPIQPPPVDPPPVDPPPVDPPVIPPDNPPPSGSTPTMFVYSNRPVGHNFTDFLPGTRNRVGGGTTISTADGSVLSVQPDGKFETRPAGTEGPYEVAEDHGDKLVYCPDGVHTYVVAVVG